MTINRLLRIVGGVVLAGFFLVSFTPLANVLAFRLAMPPGVAPADAIVVLGGGQGSEGELSPPSLLRTIRGIELYHSGLAPLLVLLGPERQDGGGSEGLTRARLATTMQVDAVDIVVEERGLTTRQEATVVQTRLESYGVSAILLVTDSHHLLRAKPLFENVGFEVHAAPADDYSMLSAGSGGRIILTIRIAREMAARIYYRMAGYL